MFETRTRMHKQKLAFIFEYYFVIWLNGLLNHIIHILIFNESGTSKNDTFHNIEIDVS